MNQALLALMALKDPLENLVHLASMELKANVANLELMGLRGMLDFQDCLEWSVHLDERERRAYRDQWDLLGKMENLDLEVTTE